MSYAIISLGGKQYRVSEGQRLLVDRLPTEEGKTFAPDVLLVGGDGAPALAPKDVTVTVKVLGQQRGPKIRIGKYKKRTGYKRHTGFRAALTQIEIESIGDAKKAPAKSKASVRPKADATPEVEAVESAAPTTVAEADSKPKAKAPAKPKVAPKPKAVAKPKKEPAGPQDAAADPVEEDES